MVTVSVRRRLPSLPTGVDDWRLVGSTVAQVLRRPRYLVIAVLAGLLGTTVVIIAQNWSLFVDVIVFGGLPLETRLRLLYLQFPIVSPNFGATVDALLVTTAILIGVTTATLAYHLREHGVTVQEGSGGVGGVLFATLGAGCAACGPAVFAGVLGLVGAGGAIALLPLEGLEFLGVAIALLVLSLYWLADGMRGSEACPVDL